MNIATAPKPFAANDYKSDYKPVWCPGCGDYSVLLAFTKAMAALQRPPEDIAVISGIGCSSRIPAYTSCYGFHGVHGRALAVGTGLKVARPELTVIVAGGDGDGFSIGGGHVAHAIRRNVDLTYIVMDNQIYGLTKGQLSPTSPRGLKTVTSAYGSVEDPVNPLMYVLGYGGRFVAQGTPADMSGLATLIEEGLRFPGFAFINVQSPCVTYGQADAQLKAHKASMKSLVSLGHDPASRLAALDLAGRYGEELYTGVFYRDPNPEPTFEAQAAERLRTLATPAPSRARILEMFEPH